MRPQPHNPALERRYCMSTQPICVSPHSNPRKGRAQEPCGRARPISNRRHGNCDAVRQGPGSWHDRELVYLALTRPGADLMDLVDRVGPLCDLRSLRFLFRQRTRRKPARYRAASCAGGARRRSTVVRCFSWRATISPGLRSPDSEPRCMKPIRYFENSGHFPMYDDPALFANVINEFCTKQPQTA